MPTDNLIRFIALEALGARVPTGHAALAIQHVDRVISGLDEEPVAAVASLGSFEAVFHMNPIPAPVGLGHHSTETQLNRFGSTDYRRPRTELLNGPQPAMFASAQNGRGSTHKQGPPCPHELTSCERT